MEKQNNNFGSFFKGIAIGGILASVVILFTAPHSGAETRQILQEKGEQLRDRSMKTLEDARERIGTVISDTRERADLAAQRIGRQMDVISHQSQPATEPNQPTA
jgi:gas vesicle protein